MVVVGPFTIRRYMEVSNIQFIVMDKAVGILNVDLSLSYRFNFRTGEYDSGYVFVEEKVLKTGAPSDNIESFRNLFRHGVTSQKNHFFIGIGMIRWIPKRIPRQAGKWNEPYRIISSNEVSLLFNSLRSTIKSRKPCSRTNSAFWNPLGRSLPMVSRITRGPANPIKAPGSAILKSPNIA